VRSPTWAGLALVLLAGAASADEARCHLLLLPAVDHDALWPKGSLRAFGHHLASGLAQGPAWEASLAGLPIDCSREDCARRQGHAAGAVAVLQAELRGSNGACALTARLLDLRGGPTRTLLRRRLPCTDAGLRAGADRLLEALQRERLPSAQQALASRGPRAASVELRRRVAALAESVFHRGLEARDRVLPALYRHLGAATPDCEAMRLAVLEELARLDGWLERMTPEASELLQAAARLRARLPAREWRRLFPALEAEVRLTTARLAGQTGEELDASNRMLARLQAACPVLSLELAASVRSHLEDRLSQLLRQAQALGLAPGPTEVTQ